jgi:hypothetical protein
MPYELRKLPDNTNGAAAYIYTPLLLSLLPPGPLSYFSSEKRGFPSSIVARLAPVGLLTTSADLKLAWLRPIVLVATRTWAAVLRVFLAWHAAGRRAHHICISVNVRIVQMWIPDIVTLEVVRKGIIRTRRTPFVPFARPEDIALVGKTLVFAALGITALQARTPTKVWE